MRKKGFTLIELLAVIIILAVIALIATPVVLDVIKDATRQANKNSVYGLLDGAKLYYTESLLDSTKEKNVNGTTNVIDEIKVSGKKPDSGTIYINSQGQVSIAVLYDDVCYKKDFSQNDLNEVGADDCSIDASTETELYNLAGNLSISDSSIEPVIVVFSDTPHYSTLDSNGNFMVTDLEEGDHEFYLITELDLSTVMNMTKEEIINSSIFSFVFNTGTKIETQSMEYGKAYIEISNCFTVKSGDASIEFPIAWRLKDSNDNGEADVGELITIGTESFYVISNNEDTIDMLAKYNLLVGGKTDNSNNENEFSFENDAYENDLNYGVQDSRALGCRVGSTSHDGIVRFSDDVYWEIPYSTYDEYEEFYNNQNAKYVYNSSSELYTYVEDYVSYLKKFIKESDDKITGSLLSESQALSLGCTDDTLCNNAPSWVYSSTYWLGTGSFIWPVPENKDDYSNYFGVLSIGADPGYYLDSETRNDYFKSATIYSSCAGVRPVITIDKSLFNE